MSKKFWALIGALIWDIGLGLMFLGMGAILLSEITNADKLLVGVTMIVLGPIFVAAGLFLKLINVESN